MARRMRPQVFHGWLATALVLGLVALLFALFRLPWTWYHLLAAFLLAVNLLTFAYYGYDKARARATRSRVPEVVLHGLTLAGGTPGAYGGMVVFRHKTIKPGFRLIFWLIVCLQLLLIVAVIHRLLRHAGYV